MSFAKKTITLVIGLAMIGGSIGAAAAGTPWERDHPWRAQVNDRLDTQNRRVNAELRQGEITPWRARELHRAIAEPSYGAIRAEGECAGIIYSGHGGSPIEEWTQCSRCSHAR